MISNCHYLALLQIRSHWPSELKGTFSSSISLYILKTTSVPDLKGLCSLLTEEILLRTFNKRKEILHLDGVTLDGNTVPGPEGEEGESPA